MKRPGLDVSAEHDSDGRLWFGPVPTQLGMGADDVRALGAAEPREAQQVDVLLRAALGTGAVPRYAGGTGA